MKEINIAKRLSPADMAMTTYLFFSGAIALAGYPA
jgi:hypothetical protein